MVQNAARLWIKLTHIDRRQRLQKALFPEGLTYCSKNGFGTAVNTYPVRTLREFSGVDKKMATHSLTSWHRLVGWLRVTVSVEDVLQTA